MIYIYTYIIDFYLFTYFGQGIIFLHMEAVWVPKFR